MKQIAHKRQMNMAEAVLEKRQQERLFLVERCEQDWLTAEQKATIRNRINFLNDESQILCWVLGCVDLSLLQPDRYFAAHW